MGPHVFVFFFKSWTKVINVTAAAVEEFEGAKTCTVEIETKTALTTHLHG